MTDKEKILAHLRKNKHVLKINVVAKACHVTNLAKIVDGKPDGRGFPSLLADHHVPVLKKYFKEMNF